MAKSDELPPLADIQHELLKLDNQICFKMYTASRAMTRAYRPLLKALGITYPQYLVMLVMWERQRDGHPQGAASVTELGEQLHLDSGTLSPLLRRLEAQGLILRRRDPADERQLVVALTAEGESMSERAVEVPKQLLCHLNMPLEQLQQLKQMLDQLLDVAGC